MVAALAVEAYAGMLVWIHAVPCVKLTVWMGALHVVEVVPEAVMENALVALLVVTVARDHVIMLWILIDPVVATLVASIVIQLVGLAAAPYVVINVVHRVS
jgi:hypothetical protein